MKLRDKNIKGKKEEIKDIQTNLIEVEDKLIERRLKGCRRKT